MKLLMNRIKLDLSLQIERATPLLEVKNLSITFRQYRKGLHETTLQVISNLHITVNRGEILAIVGASGSGKSLLANAILGLLPENAYTLGSIKFMGKEISHHNINDLRGHHISLIPQSVNALDPLMKTGKQVQAGVKRKERQHDVFERLRLSPEVSEYYPFELSGGMARRVLAATAIIGTAELIIADEPTPGLDPDSLDETTKYIQELKIKGKGIMFITHDIDTALKVADRIAVFYGGQIMEITRAAHFKGNGKKLLHPYTKALWNALPQNGFTPLPGNQPLPGEILAGCVFYPRCPNATDECKQKQPESRHIHDGMVRCFYA